MCDLSSGCSPAGEHYFPGVGQVEMSHCLRRELIHTLYISPYSHNDLIKHHKVCTVQDIIKLTLNKRSVLIRTPFLWTILCAWFFFLWKICRQINGYAHVRRNLQEQNRHEVQFLLKFKRSNQGIIFKRMDVSPNVYPKLVVRVRIRLTASARQPWECHTGLKSAFSKPFWDCRRKSNPNLSSTYYSVVILCFWCSVHD